MKNKEKLFFEPLLDDVIKELKLRGVETYPKTTSPFVGIKNCYKILSGGRFKYMPHRISIVAGEHIFCAEVIFNGSSYVEREMENSIKEIRNSVTFISKRETIGELNYDQYYVAKIAKKLIDAICLYDSVSFSEREEIESIKKLKFASDKHKIILQTNYLMREIEFYILANINVEIFDSDEDRILELKKIKNLLTSTRTGHDRLFVCMINVDTEGIDECLKAADISHYDMVESEYRYKGTFLFYYGSETEEEVSKSKWYKKVSNNGRVGYLQYPFDLKKAADLIHRVETSSNYL